MSGPDFLFAVHNHQPVGNFDHVFETAFADCYRPLLEGLVRHPGFRFALHFSGPLWEYMEKNERACWDLVKDLAGRGQVELLGGGFYEPILSLIPEADRIGQVRMMNDFLSENFGRKPRGLWLTERVWEPHLPKSLAAAGIEFTLLDEEHFHCAGVGDLHTTYVTEEEGHTLRLFPIDKTLRYLIPFRPLDDLDAYLGRIRAAGGTAILGDDGEKFGVWPGTRKWVYEDGWLEKFLRYVEERDIRTTSFSDHMDAHPPAGRVYLPPASYEEMTEWVLEPEEQAAYAKLRVRGRAGGPPVPPRRLLPGFPAQVSRGEPPPQADGRGLRPGPRRRQQPRGHGRSLQVPVQRSLLARRLRRPLPAPPAGGRLPPSSRSRKADARSGRLAGIGLRLRRPGGALLQGRDLRAAGPAGLGRDSRRDRLPPLAEEPLERPHAAARGLSPDALRDGGGGGERGEKHPRARTSGCLRKPGSSSATTGTSAIPSSTASSGPGRDRKTSAGTISSTQGDFAGGAFAASAEGAVLRLERRGSVRAGAESVPLIVRKTIASADGGLRVEIELENPSDRALALTYGSEWNLLAFPHEFALRGAAGASLYGGALSFEPAGAASVVVVRPEDGFPIRGRI